MQHRDRDRIAGAIMDEPADVWVMFEAIKGDLMAVLRKDGLEKTPEKVHRSTSLGEDEWIVG
jgi:hypothetical protein